MGLKNLFIPKTDLSDEERAKGLKLVIWEGIPSLGYTSITTSGLLAAFALILGANNLQIGILAAIPFITQLLQIPGILIIEKLRRRKVMTLVTWTLAQLLWIPIALIPIFIETPGGAAVSALLFIMALRFTLVAFTNCNWFSWIRDLVPQNILGSVFSRRLALAAGAAAVFGLASSFFIDYWNSHNMGTSAMGYTWALLFGAVFLAMLSPVMMARIPEPRMLPTPEPKPSLGDMIFSPYRDKNYFQLIRFLFLWSLALNLAVPFFSVYMLQRLELPVSLVIGLNVLSQIFNISFSRAWGRFVDKFGSKVVLSVCASLYLLVIIGWTFTTMPERYSFTIPLLFILHIFAGIAVSGVTLAISTIGIKLAQPGQATSYMAASSLATNLGSGIGPIMGGFLAYFFAQYSMTMDIIFTAPEKVIDFGFIYLEGLDFLFLITFVVGLLTLNTLVTVHEEGEVERDVVIDELMMQTRGLSRNVSPTPGLGFATVFPFNYLRKVPGADVAIGVTAYQLGQTLKMISDGAVRGIQFTSDIAKTIEHSISSLLEGEEDLMEQTTELAKETIIEAIRYGVEKGEQETVLTSAIEGTLNALVQVNAQPEAAVRGVGYGVIAGAAATRLNLEKTAVEAVEAVKQSVPKLGITEYKSIIILKESMYQAAKEQGGDALPRIRKAIPEEMTDEPF